jgi:hypothetical protein
VSQACGLLWNCSDILPNLVVNQLADCNVTLTRLTYAAAARALRQRISGLLSAAPA